MNNILKEAFRITNLLLTTEIARKILQTASQREVKINKLLHLFPENREDVLSRIRTIEIKTPGLDWCYEQASTGKTWPEIKQIIGGEDE